MDVAGFAPAELELKEEWGEDQAAFAEQDGRVEGGTGAQEEDEGAAGDDFAVSPGEGEGAPEEGVASAFGVVEPQDGVERGFVPDAALAAAPEPQQAHWPSDLRISELNARRKGADEAERAEKLANYTAAREDSLRIRQWARTGSAA